MRRILLTFSSSAFFRSSRLSSFELWIYASQIAQGSSLVDSGTQSGNSFLRISHASSKILVNHRFSNLSDPAAHLRGYTSSSS